MDEYHLVSSVGRRSRWWSDPNSRDGVSASLPSRTPGHWEFLIAVATAKGITWEDSLVRPDDRDRERTVGAGATSAVRTGKIRGRVVALKINFAASQALGHTYPDELGQYLSRSAKELRILSHDKLRDNPHILDVFACSIQDIDGLLICALAIEYSKLGDLRRFFKSRPPIAFSQILRLCLDVAQGLQSLHALHICHGDVKLENALVFQDTDEAQWHVKLCDFGHAYVGNGNLSEAVRLSIGTRLLCAPELYHDNSIFSDPSTLLDALKTDVFSYGLLTWEAIKHGDTYFEDKWSKSSNEYIHDLTIEDKEDFLLGLSDGDLGELAVKSLDAFTPIGDGYSDISYELVARALSYNPNERPGMCHIVTLLSKRAGVRDFESYRNSKGKEPLDVRRFPHVTTIEKSLGEIFHIGLKNSLFDADSLPPTFQLGVVADLEAIQYNPYYSDLRQSDAAYLLSECHMYGLGVGSNLVSAVQWLGRALSLGDAKASAWYERLCNSIGHAPQNEVPSNPEYHDLEWTYRESPNEGYLIARIHYYQLLKRRAFWQAPSPLSAQISDLNGILQSSHTLQTFNSEQIDRLDLLHAAAFKDHEALKAALAHDSSELSSTTELGRNLLFYACFAGDIHSLKYLCERYRVGVLDDDFGINPLHLCVFFDPAYIEEAVTHLLTVGANLNSSSTDIFMEDHDLVLRGTPLEWAVCCRYHRLVDIFIASGAENNGLSVAVNSFFYEIVDSMLSADHSELKKSECSFAVDVVKRPFGHMIAHGTDYLYAISKTFDVFKRHHIPLDDVKYCIFSNESLGVSLHRLLDRVTRKLQESSSILWRIARKAFFMLLPKRFYDRYTILRQVVDLALTPIDLEIARQLVKRSGNIKSRDKSGSSALDIAILRSGQNEAWGPLLDQLLEVYEIRELVEQDQYGKTYLGSAIVADSITGAKALLKKGVDINSPAENDTDSPPLLMAAEMSSSEMLDLLLSHGASTVTANLVSRSALTESLNGLLHTGRKVDALIEHSSMREVCLGTLHDSFHRVMAEELAHGLELERFRHLIASAPIRPFLDEPTSSQGSPILHKASAELHLDMVQLLIEAGADVTKAIRYNEKKLDALQIALENAKLFGHIDIADRPKCMARFKKSKGNAFEVVCMLLGEHVSRESTYEGIGRLHLAAYTENLEMVQKLLASHPEEKFREGHWPGFQENVKPYHLIGMPPELVDLSEDLYLPETSRYYKGKYDEMETIKHWSDRLQNESKEHWTKRLQTDPRSQQELRVQGKHYDNRLFEVIVSPLGRREKVRTIQNLLLVE